MTNEQSNHTVSCDYAKTQELTKDCPACMRIWVEFIEEHNIHVVTDRRIEIE